MNLLSVSQILAQSIDSFYLLLDKEFTVKAIEDNFNCTKIFNSSIFTIGKNFLNSFNIDDQKIVAAAFKSLDNQEENLQVVKLPIELQSGALNITWNISSIKKEDGSISGYELLGFHANKEARKNTTEQGKTMPSTPSLFDQDSQPYLSYDFDGNIIKFNPAFETLLQFEKNELIEKSFFSLVATSDLPLVRKNTSNAANGLPTQFICSLVNKNNEKVVVNIINTPLIQDGAVVGINAYVKEMTEKTVKNKILIEDEKRLLLVLGRLKKVLDSSLDMICAFDEKGKFTYVSAACKEILGYKTKEVIGKIYLDFVHPEDVERSFEATKNIKKGVGTTNFENRVFRKDGSIANLVWSSRWEASDKRYYCIARDATEKKLSEANLKASEEKYKTLFYNHSIPSWIYEIGTFQLLEVNEAAIEHYGYTQAEFLHLKLENLLFEGEIERHRRLSEQKDFYNQKHKGLWKHKKKNGEIFYAEISSNSIDYQGKRARLILSIDRTEQIIAEQELRKSNERFLFLSQATSDAMWDWDLQTNKVSWSEGLNKMFAFDNTQEPNQVDWRYNNLHPEDRERVETKIKFHLENNIPQWEDEYRMKAGNSFKYIYDRGYIIYNEKNEPVRMIGAMQDLTERKAHENMLQNLNNSLEKRAKELAESNEELERFAYVTSHDLQEPLRMVTSFLQLLEKRYKDKLDNKANEYINYAVDGAERMKQLILDLLEYSRVNSSKAEVEEVDVNNIIEDLKLTYKTFLSQTKGTINFTNLPKVEGNKTQILQLFQNVIGNAIKYRSSLPPVINISFEEENGFYKFAIADNGIGIDPKFFHKIFIIFQRLHNREEYSGTGIGLAICKKIIDKHGGRIWVESNPGQGTTFYFTLPKSKR
jgi:PAS domain S-box-containing protein